MTPMQTQILKVLAKKKRWTTREEIAAATGYRKGYAQAMGSPTQGKFPVGCLEQMQLIEHRRDQDKIPIVPLQYRITALGRQSI